MRCWLLVLILSVSLFGACATHIERVDAYGLVWLVSRNDIHAAVAASREGRIGAPPVHHVQVVSRDEIRVYATPAGIESIYDVVQKTGGKWQVTELIKTSAGPM